MGNENSIPTGEGVLHPESWNYSLADSASRTGATVHPDAWENAGEDVETVRLLGQMPLWRALLA